MLQIKDIRKKYITGDLVQTALDGVSLNLRDNEFVAILGPSGSGKTTLLNVIGGLDRYDSGDLVINGISTKKYTDRDWDSYRNHTIGFVFQSYNLIPHQSVLANVELALTISGISRDERKKRAIKALQDVGLGNQLHKRPNQMSGGQMQRVAVARALVNDPDILLADEPTGALDSETSVQIMELLKEVSKDRLVVMVTHNPELAEDYANRIVRVKDGKIISDTNPYEVNPLGMVPPEHRNMGKSSMSWFTALSLSFNNLWTKKARTLLTAFAGSIGIIGIALIMSLSTGFQNYIDKIQEDTLSNYPLVIQSESANMASTMMSIGASIMSGTDAEDGTVVEQPMMTQMFSQISTNDLAGFKDYLEEHYDSIEHTINSVKYGYGVKPLIYAADADSVRQVNPGTIMEKLLGSSSMSTYMDSDVFQEMIDNRDLVEAQYDVLQGRWPENYDELIVVLQEPDRITDYMAYTLGLKDMKTLEEMIAQVMRGEEVSDDGQTMSWSYEDLMSLEFRLVEASDLYRYNGEYGVWEDMSDDETYMKKLVEQGKTLKVVGIVCPKDGVTTTTLSTGIAYTKELTDYVIDTAAETKIVQDQLADKTINVFTGKGFDEEGSTELSFENMISVDADAISSAFGMDVSTEAIMELLQKYLNDVVDSAKVDTQPARAEFLTTFSTFSTKMLTAYIQQNADESGQAELRLADVESLVEQYLASEEAVATMAAMAETYSLPAESFSQVYRPLMIAMLDQYIAENLQQLPSQPPEETRPEETAPAETEPTQSATEPSQNSTTESTAPAQTETDQLEIQVQGLDPLDDEIVVPELPDVTELSAAISQAEIEPMVQAYLESPVVTGTATAMSAKMMETTIRETVMAQLATFGSRLGSYMGTAMQVDAAKISSAFQFNMTQEDLLRLMQAMSGQEQESSATANLQSLGYADRAEPTSISIYMTDFAGKEEFMDFLDEYNAKMEAAGQEEKVIHYTDVTGVMMSSVRTIIDSVSYALIAFVAVSLIVSSIMIGIITYISVMERTKEIGVLRAIGASKHNISQVFNAETFIIGLCSGLIGIGVTLLTLIPGNQLLYHLTNNPDITAQLPVVNALVLVGLSVLLTLIGGFIPAKKAAKKDPVIALRSE